MKGIKKFLTIALLGILAFSIIGCNQESNKPTGDNVGSFESYDELKSYIESLSSNQYSRVYTNAMMEGAEETDSVAMDSGNAPTTTKDDRDFSETNNQVDGVEEADKILTDGYKIYIVSGSKFFIVDADTLSIDFTYQIENGYLGEMYLYGDKVVLMSQVYSYTEDVCSYSDYWYYEDGSSEVESSSDQTTDFTDPDGEITTDWDSEENTEIRTYTCYRYSYGTQITVLDVSDAENTSVVRELYFDSSYMIDSRMIDEQLYLILNNYNYYWGLDEEEAFVPKYMDSVVSNELSLLPANKIFYMPYDGSSYSFLTMVSLDVTDNEEANVKAYLGSTWQIYMSQTNLYTIINRSTYLEEDGIYDYQTFVVRFEIEDNELIYKAIGEIEGYPLNQFSMDEYDGVFRIFTTGYTYDSEGWKIDNFLFLLDATTDDIMEQKSVLSGLGKPGERIYSARFVEEIGYCVTFEVIDPLYKIDLSDPENPEVVGQLEEEGVSDYLHVINDNLMIGIGRQAETDGEWTNFTGVKVTLYDTSGNNPVNLEDYLVEGRYSYTNVMWDHKAFLTFEPTGADFTYIGIPVYEYFEDYYGYSQSMYLFKVYDDGDLELITKLTHMEEEEEGYYRYFDSIERSVIIEDNVYTVSYSSIKMFDMTNDFNMLEETELNPSYYEYWGYPEAVDSEEVMD